MAESTPASYHVVFSRDPETKSVVAEIPTLEIADYGADVPEALERLQAMVSFDLECLIQERTAILRGDSEEIGLYLRVRPPADVA